MKFVCDKCKTRYSIGEDRVRGKILKIRCKNCSNVITVREGMDAEAPAAADPADRRTRPTTAAPMIGSIANAKPPPTPAPAALDEEWYVSIDGVQSGPLSRPDAQKWVAGKPFEADLHCWSEGFDDWLSVDKVSHFRNLRKPRAPVRPKTIPPPTPAKPLFAATMAAIEKDASAAAPPLPASAPAVRKSAPAPSSARVNGASSPIPQVAKSPTAKGTGSGQVPSIPASASATPRRTTSPSGRFNIAASSSHAALAAAFDPEPEDSDSADSATQMEAPAFTDVEPAPKRPGAPSRPANNPFEFGHVANAQPEPKLADPFAKFEPKADAKPVKPIMDDDEDSLSIGEVSRVVKLADLAPRPKPARNATAASPALAGGSARLSQTGAVNRVGIGTQSHPKLSPTELGMNVDPDLVAQQGPAPDESIVAQSFRQRHRRGMVALLAFAGLLVAGVIGVLIYITSGQTEEIGGGLGGGTKTIDTSRPEDIVRRQLPPTPTETGSGSAAQQKPRWTGTRPTNPNTPVVEDDPKGNSLQASEIEDMAAKQGEGTKRCYMRAQKGALGFEIADLKKIAVTLTVGKEGTVSTVNLSSHEADTFGVCLIARIKAWKFRESPSGGTFRISLAFSN